MKRLAHHSQYFLRNPRLVKELVGHSVLKRTDTVLDIGAGSGVIASVLAEACEQVIAVEYEPRTAQKLRDNMKVYSNVTVYEGDFLTMPLPEGRYSVFANIPFHLSSPILRRLTEAEYSPEAIYLIVQRQFAKKLQIDQGQFTGLLGAYIAPLYSVRIRKALKRTDFWPHPNVDTVLVELLRRPKPLLPNDKMLQYRRFVARCYESSVFFAKAPLRAVGIPDDTRPSQMTIMQWLMLFQYTVDDKDRR